MRAIKRLSRKQTHAILIHIFPGLPSLGPPALVAAFTSLGFYEAGVHFILDQKAEVHDARDLSGNGLYAEDTIDITVLCSGDQPTLKQQRELEDLIKALKQDHPDSNLQTIEVRPCPPPTPPKKKPKKSKASLRKLATETPTWLSESIPEP